jgi:hypothetical protein
MTPLALDALDALDLTASAIGSIASITVEEWASGLNSR